MLKNIVLSVFVSVVFSSNLKAEQTHIESGAKIALFDGTSTKEFVGKTGKEIDWPIVDGCLVSTAKETRSNHISTKLFFRDADIHVEFNMDKKSSGNSGVYIHGHYEVQIFDSTGKKEIDDKMIGAVYGIHAPKVNAGLSPGKWQTYDATFRAPRRNAEGKIIEKGRITAKLNGKLVLENVEIDEPVSKYHPYRYKSTSYLKEIEQNLLATGVGPLFLQDHDSPCRFRNVWIKTLDDKAYYHAAPAVSGGDN